MTARPERREGRKLTNQCPQAKPSTSPANHRPKIIIQLSVIWTSRVRHSCPRYCGIRSPLTGREINELSPLISGAAIIYANSLSVDVCIVHARDFDYCRAFFGGRSLFRSYSSLYILALRLDREALPLVLSASLLARGLTARFVSLAFYPLYCFILCTALPVIYRMTD